MIPDFLTIIIIKFYVHFAPRTIFMCLIAHYSQDKYRYKVKMNNELDAMTTKLSSLKVRITMSLET